LKIKLSFYILTLRFTPNINKQNNYNMDAKRQALIAQVAKFGMGAKILSAEEAIEIDLGPLAALKGTWVAKPFEGWNVIAVPGPKNPHDQGFILEVIPYSETLTFTPVVVAGNRGPFVDGVQQEQHITGLIYEQVVTSACDTELCNTMKFPAGTEIHAETGMFLNMLDFNSVVNPDDPGGIVQQFTIARLSNIPHGNAVMALGTSLTGAPANNDIFEPAPIRPTPTIAGESLPLGYGTQQYGKQQFPEVFNQGDPNTFLRKTLGDDVITAMTTLALSTKNGTGGILNIPYIQKNIDTTEMQSTFWIETIKNPEAGKPDIMQLQYSQTINLVFPATGSPQLINWPHVTVSTLRKEH